MDSTIHDREILSAARAAKFLGVKRETLYAYASRGVLTRVPLGKGRSSGYLRADLERLKARSDARAGHGAVASGALRFGEPVLDSWITSVDARGPAYQGFVAVDLAARGTTFEQAAELLWTGVLPDVPPIWSPMPPPRHARALAALGAGARMVARLGLLVAALGTSDPEPTVASRESELAKARRLIARMAAGLVPGGGGGVAQRWLLTLGARAGDAARRAVDCALVLVADHELNPSSFAARVAAGAGANLYACMSAAIATVSGPRHGGDGDRVEALVAEAGSARAAREVVLARSRRGEAVPGFGHPLYPAGDPRASPLLDAARSLSPASTATVDAIIRSAYDALGLRPTVDVGLVALTGSLGLPKGSATALFAMGRTAGWVAHAIEQREAGYLLRPRARFMGTRPPPA